MLNCFINARKGKCVKFCKERCGISQKCNKVQTSMDRFRAVKMSTVKLLAVAN